jgi:hypothetical protein
MDFGQISSNANMVSGQLHVHHIQPSLAFPSTIPTKPAAMETRNRYELRGLLHSILIKNQALDETLNEIMLLLIMMFGPDVESPDKNLSQRSGKRFIMAKYLTTLHGPSSIAWTSADSGIGSMQSPPDLEIPYLTTPESDVVGHVEPVHSSRSGRRDMIYPPPPSGGSALINSADTIPTSTNSFHNEIKTARDYHLYGNAVPQADGLFHCPWEGDETCSHRPEKLKCNYEYVK